MPPILIAQNISKRFGANPLFDNLSFAVHDGDRIGLIGPNAHPWRRGRIKVIGLCVKMGSRNTPWSVPRNYDLGPRMPAPARRVLSLNSKEL
jgi:hypothetical protein